MTDTTNSSILELSKQVANKKTDNRHFSAVQAQIAFANEVLRGISTVSTDGNGLAAETLLRTLFEVVASAIILAKHGDKLEDFVRHGRFTELRMMRVIEEPPLKARLASIVAATEAEYQELYAEFKEQRWHKMGTTESFTEAEFQPGIYDRYYRRASAISHGQPYVTVRHGKVEARPVPWKNFSTGAVNMASLVMVTFLAIVSREFKLGLDDEIVKLGREADADAARHMDQIRTAARMTPTDR